MNKEDYFKYYIQGSDHYLLPTDEFNELFEEMVNWKEECKQLSKQLEYLRSGEYYNQLRFERDMLQDLVDKGKVSKEDKKFIDCNHRNTELLEENKELKADYGNKAQVERDLLQMRIDKAIHELQRPKTTDYNGIRFVYDKQTENALKILKGDSNE